MAYANRERRQTTIAKAINDLYQTWESDGGASPSADDVLDAAFPSLRRTDRPRFEALSEDVFDRQCDGYTVDQLAEWLSEFVVEIND